MSTTVTWDGKNLAAIQALLPASSRDDRVITYHVDKDWNLTVAGIPVLVGQQITVIDPFSVRITEA
jgi:hypothetical protein